MFGKFLIKVVRIPVGFLLCSIGVTLPWRARTAYLNVVGFALDMLLRSAMFVSFFMEVGFSTEPARGEHAKR